MQVRMPRLRNFDLASVPTRPTSKNFPLTELMLVVEACWRDRCGIRLNYSHEFTKEYRRAGRFQETLKETKRNEEKKRKKERKKMKENERKKRMEEW